MRRKSSTLDDLESPVHTLLCQLCIFRSLPRKSERLDLSVAKMLPMDGVYFP